jgi:hypothetical protein
VRHFLRRCLGVFTPLARLWDVPPNQPKTPTHTVRVDDELWQAALRKAHDRGETLTDVIVRALKRYLRD